MISNRAKPAPASSGTGSSYRRDRAMRLRMYTGCGLALAVAAGALLKQWFSDSPLTVSTPSASIAEAVIGQGLALPPAGSVRAARSETAVSVEREISPRSRAWVERLSRSSERGRLTTESALAWDEVLAQVIASGREA